MVQNQANYKTFIEYVVDGFCIFLRKLLAICPDADQSFTK
jgi:hypothetical protein